MPRPWWGLGLRGAEGRLQREGKGTWWSEPPSLGLRGTSRRVGLEGSVEGREQSGEQRASSLTSPSPECHLVLRGGPCLSSPCGLGSGLPTQHGGHFSGGGGQRGGRQWGRRPRPGRPPTCLFFPNSHAREEPSATGSWSPLTRRQSLRTAPRAGRKAAAGGEPLRPLISRCYPGTCADPQVYSRLEFRALSTKGYSSGTSAA